MKTKIRIFLLVTASFLLAETMAIAQSSTGLNTYNAAYYLGWSSSNDLPFILNTSTKMILKNTGYFGVGTPTPLGTLDVLGANNAASWTYIRGNTAGTKPSTSFNDGGLTIGYNYTNGGGEVDFMSNKREGLTVGGFRFQDWTAGGSGTVTDLVTIQGGGNTGIGTTTPASKLDVEGGISVGATYSGTTAAPTNGAIIEGKVGIGNSSPNIKLDVYGTTGYPTAFGSAQVNGVARFGTAQDVYLDFGTGNSTPWGFWMQAHTIANDISLPIFIKS